MHFMKILLTYFFLLLSIVALPQEGIYNVNPYGVNMSFIKQSTKILNSDFASNVLKIENNTNKDLKLELQITPPAGWRMFSKNIVSLNINAKDSLFIPLRLKPIGDVKGNTNYVVNAFLSTESFTITNAIWYISIEKSSSWSASLPRKSIFFTNTEDSTAFSIDLSNSGNSDEQLLVEVVPEKGLLLLAKDGNYVNNLNVPVFLKAGVDTSLVFYVKRKDEEVKTNKQNLAQNASKNRLNVKIKNERGASSQGNIWNGNLEFVTLPNNSKLNPSKFKSIPFSIDFNAYDVLDYSTSASLNIYTNHILKNNSRLSFFHQSNYVRNQINLKSFLGNYFFAGYSNKHFSIELGSIGSGIGGGSLSGKGIKGKYFLETQKLGSHSFTGLYIRRGDFFSNYTASGYGFMYNLQTKYIKNENVFQAVENQNLRSKQILYSTNILFKVFKNHSLNIGGGYSIEELNWNIPLKLTGWGARLGYGGSFRKVKWGLNANLGSQNYLRSRGLSVYNGFFTYRHNNNLSFSLGGIKNNYNIIQYYQGVIVNDSAYSNQDNYYLKINASTNENIFTIQPTYQKIFNNILKSEMSGVNFDFRKRRQSKLNYNIGSYIGTAWFKDFPILKNIFLATVQGSLRYGNLQLSSRYYYGPFYQYDHILYTQTKLNQQKIFSTLFYEHAFNDYLKLEVNANHSFNTYRTRNQFILNGRLLIFSKNGLEFNFNARYYFLGEGEYTRSQYLGQYGGTVEIIVPKTSNNNFEIGAGLKLNVNVPVTYKRNHYLRVIAFKDVNGNGKMDPEEKGLENMLIILSKNDSINLEDEDEFRGVSGSLKSTYELITDEHGNVKFNNLTIGNYIITARPLTTMGGWFDGKTFYRTVDKDITIYIPLSKGARVSGGILMERSKYSDNKNINISNIRVTAVNVETGLKFSSLTDAAGQFEIFAPNGTYTIVINEQAVSSRYEFMQNNIPLVISNDFENYNVSFYLVEKERNVRIGNGNGNGNRLPNLPIQRSNGSNGGSGNGNGHKTSGKVDQNTQIIDPSFLPVVEPKETGKVWVVQFFPGEMPRKAQADFDTVKNFTDVRCIVGQNSGYLYISKSYSKKGDAKKLLKNVQDKGFAQAQVISLVFGTKEVNQTTPVDNNSNTNKETTKPDTSTTKVETPVDNNPPTASSVTIKSISTDDERNLYRVEIKVSSEKLDENYFKTNFAGLIEVFEIEQDGLFKYSIGAFASFDEAKKFQKEMIKKYNLADSFITQYKQAW